MISSMRNNILIFCGSANLQGHKIDSIIQTEQETKLIVGSKDDGVNVIEGLALLVGGLVVKSQISLVK